MRPALVLLALAGPVAAQEPISFDGLDDAPAVYAYPGDDALAPPFSLTLVAVDDSPHVATLRFHNVLTTWQPNGPHPLRVGAIVLVAEVRMGNLSEPDTIVVSTPPGYVADPPFITVPEGGDAEIRILEWPMG
jgi:hypothetical protein